MSLIETKVEMPVEPHRIGYAYFDGNTIVTLAAVSKKKIARIYTELHTNGSYVKNANPPASNACN